MLLTCGREKVDSRFGSRQQLWVLVVRTAARVVVSGRPCRPVTLVGAAMMAPTLSSLSPTCNMDGGACFVTAAKTKWIYPCQGCHLVNDYLVRSGNLCAVCHRSQKLSSRREYCTGRPCYQMYLKHLEIQQQGGGRDVEMSVTEPGASASAQPPFQQGGRDVEASVTEPAASANGASSTGPGASAWAPCPPHPRPPPLPPATGDG